MGSPNTATHTSTAYRYTTLAADYNVAANDPLATNAREGRPNRTLLVVTEGTLNVVDLEGTTVSIASVAAGTLIPIQCRTILATSTAEVLVLW